MANVLMHHFSLDSSSIRSVRHESKTNVLEIEFQSGSVYRYFAVPLAVLDGLVEAPSKGGYFNRVIRSSYPFDRVK